MLVTSPFNIFEISQTQGESRKKIIDFINIFPLGIIYTFPQLIEFEKKSTSFNNEMIMFATGVNTLFNIQISNILDIMNNDESMKKSIGKMYENFNTEINNWKKNQKEYSWMKSFHNNLIKSMNDSFQIYDNYFNITKLGLCKSLEVLAFIKNQFIYNSKKEIKINSIIDSYNASILPYVDTYITERTVCSWLNIAKQKFIYLKDKKIINISTFFN